MDPNARPETLLPDGRRADDVFGEYTVDGIWPHVLVPHPGGGPEDVAAALHQLAAAEVIPMPPARQGSFEELATALWEARRRQQAGWPREGWPLERIAGGLRAHGIAAEWALPVESDADAVDALAHHRAAGLRGAVFMTEADAVQLALEPGDGHVRPEGFVTPRRRGLFGRREIDVDEYRTACEDVARALVTTAGQEGIRAHWNGDWEHAVVLEGIQYVARLP